MILKETNGGPVWVFGDDECADFAYICSCMPHDKLEYRERQFIRQMEVKFRLGRGGHLTQAQWDFFAHLAEKHSSAICPQDEAAAAIRQAVKAVSAR